MKSIIMASVLTIFLAHLLSSEALIIQNHRNKYILHCLFDNNPVTLKDGVFKTFYSQSKRTHPSKRLSAVNVDYDDNASYVNNPMRVDRVTICMGELCQCQEESSHVIMKDLRSRELPYEVQDSCCLGACGVGAMVSIDYLNGDFDLVTGLDETHAAVGIADIASVHLSEESTRKDEVTGYLSDLSSNRMQKENDTTLDDDQTFTVKEFHSSKDTPSKRREEELLLQESEQRTTAIDQRAPKLEEKAAVKESRMQHGAVERMRAKADEAEVANPWISMAVYLAQKAKESVLN